jgi:type 1 fimbriae regulatory protein FimB
LLDSEHGIDYLVFMQGVSTRTKRSRIPDYLTKEEMSQLLAASKAPGNSRNPVRNYAILLLMFRHGLRVSELCRLRLTDVNVSTKEMHVNRLKDCDSGPHDLLEGEAPAIKAWLAERSDMIRGTGKSPETLFISEQLRPLSRTTVWLMITRIAKAARLDHLSIHPHTMRHSAGYAMVNSGTDIRISQGYLGHKDISSTVRYTHLDKKRFKGIKGLV